MKYYREHLGAAEGTVRSEEKNDERVLSPKQQKKWLRSIVNVEDFEGAAAAIMPAKSFACEFYRDIRRKRKGNP